MSDAPTGLVFVQPDDTAPAPWNILLYGPGGQGKTAGALSAPGPIVMLNAEGESGVRWARKRYRDRGPDYIREYPLDPRAPRRTLEEVARYLEAGAEGARTFVLDSIGETYSELLYECGGKNPKIQHYGDVNGEILRFVRFLCKLDMNVVLVAHEQIDDSEDGGALRRPQTGGRRLPEEVIRKVDVVGYCALRLDDEGKKVVGSVAQLVQAKGRRAKDRSGVLGMVRELDLTEWITTMNAEYSGSDLPWQEGYEGRDGDS